MRRMVQMVVRLLPRDGISLVEVVVAIMLLGAGLVAVTSAGSAVVAQLKTSRTEVEFWAALQSVGDSLQQLGYGNVESCWRPLNECQRVDGRFTFEWIVVDKPIDATLPENLERIELFAEVTEPVWRREELHLYLADIR